MSRYDYRDPGQDPEYCDGLAPETDDERDDWDRADLDELNDVERRESRFWQAVNALSAEYPEFHIIVTTGEE